MGKRRQEPQLVEPPDDLTDHEKNLLWRWHIEHYPTLYRLPNGKCDTRGLRRYLRRMLDEMLDHRRMYGKWCTAKGYLPAARQWIRNDHAWNHGKAPVEPPSSAPNPKGNKPFEGGKDRMQSVADVLPLFRGKETG